MRIANRLSRRAGAASCAFALMAVMAVMAASADEIPYTVPPQPWPDAMGNHRARVQVTEKADAARVHIPWRRRDAAPEKKHIIVVDAATGREIENVARLAIAREFGDLRGVGGAVIPASALRCFNTGGIDWQGRPDVPATAYVRPGRTLVSVASWAPDPVRVALKIDWKALDLDPAAAILRAPAVAGFQEKAEFKPGDAIPVPPGRGWLLFIGNGSAAPSP